MNRKFFIAMMVFLLAPTPLFAGYDDLRRDFDAYTPPVFGHAGSAETAREDGDAETPGGNGAAETDGGNGAAEIAGENGTAETAGAGGSAGEDAFAAEQRKLEERALAWEAVLTEEKEGGGLLHPVPAVRKSVKGAAEDDAVAARLLSEKFSLEVLEALTVQRNPGIKAAAQRLSAAIDGFGQVSNLEEILRRYEAFTEGSAAGVGPMLAKDTIRKKFPFPGLLSLKGEVVGKDAEIARQKLQMAARNAVSTARKTWYRLDFLGKSIAITEETVALFRHLENVVSTRYEAGKTSFQDVIKIGIRLSTLEEELVTLGEKRRNAAARILELLNLPPGTPVGTTSPRGPERGQPDIGALTALAMENRQELAIIRAKQGKIGRMIEMAETMVIPPYTLGLSLYEDRAVVQAGSVAVKDAFAVTTSASRGIGLPKNSWYGTNDPYLRQTRKNLLAVGEELKKAEAQTAMLVRNGWFGLDLALREERLFAESIRDQSRAALDVSTSGYEAGNVSFADVITSYTGWLKASLSLEKRRSDIGVARAELLRIVGKPF